MMPVTLPQNLPETSVDSSGLPNDSTTHSISPNQQNTFEFPHAAAPSKASSPPSQKWTRGTGFWRSFVAICLPLLLSALEGSITNTALPTISRALDLGAMFSWVATAFLISSTIFQPLYGQLADIWGRKYPMILAVSTFAIGSAICGWAKSGTVLVFGRIIQGLGTGAIDLFAELILSDLVPLRQRGTYMSIKHCVFAAGITIGTILGGVFAEKNWRWCFWINIPVCVLALILLFFWLKTEGGVKTRDTRLMGELRKIDALGTSILTSSMVLILVSVSNGGTAHPWTGPIIVTPLIIGSIGLITFPFWENSRWCQYPIMPPSIFSHRTSATAFALTGIHGFLTYGVQFFLPPFFQAVKGSTPSRSGIQVLPTTLIIVVTATIGGPLLSAWGKYRPIHQLGCVCMVLGLGLHTVMTRSTPIAAWVIFQFIFASGSGIMVSTMLPAVQVELPDRANAAAGGAWAFLRGVGSLLGVAIPSAVFNMHFTKLLPTITSLDARHSLENGKAYEHATSVFIDNFDDSVKAQIVKAFTQSLRSVWIVFLALAGIGFLLTFLERQIKMRKELDTSYGLKLQVTNKITPEASDSDLGSSELSTRKVVTSVHVDAA
ncbi:major facilitator superfamily domain-containing protein [Dendryphion nanum]|uniref:Major facilitator superfamily domain-containing protein n=1 Tax=Dendryphion nanum TaxID=256645 RepID=A0A9P9IGE2_9PLEO|nr:major facilitator superfamily domain-containing protein [Dendryphion nanum]